MTSPKILEVKNLSVALDEVKIVQNISFSIAKDEVLAIIGPNGAGKSVLLKTIIGILKPTSGEIIFEPNIKIGYIPQRLHLDYYLPMTVREFLNLKPKVTKEEIKKVFDLVKIDNDFANKSLAKLSGGELQKTLVAWTIADNPDLLILDEPTENVDVVGQESIYNLLHELQDKTDMGIIIVSHDLTAVSKFATSVLCLNKKMVCFGEPIKTLNAENLASLYGGESAFFHHAHHQNHLS